MLKKAHLYQIFAAAVVILTAACSSIDYDRELYDDEEWLVQEGDTFTYSTQIITHAPGELQLGFTGFYGKHSVYRIDAAETTRASVDIIIGDNLQGLYKVCLLSPGKTLTLLAEGAGSFSHDIPFSAGKHYILLVGHKARGRVSVSIRPGRETPGFSVGEIL